MKKIGIMTWYTYDNFGSVLQAYALEQTLSKLGYDAELINYLPKKSYVLSNRYLQRIYKKLNYKRCKMEIKAYDSHFLYEKFRKEYLKIGMPSWTSNELYQLNNIYDAFVCGSDQIWAPTVFDENYFLRFVNCDEKKIAYAPSIGLPNISNKKISMKMRILISKIPFLSIREIQGQSLIYELCGKKPKVVLDPTLLLKKEEWDRVIKRKIEGSYMVGYFLGNNKSYIDISRKLAQKYGMKFIIIPTKKEDFIYEEKLDEPLGPVEFVELIRNAKCVFTDSFHGTIFSLNFEVPFVTFKRFKDNSLSQNSRIYNILAMTEMEERIYNDNYSEFEKNLFNIKFDKSHIILKKKREESLAFLEDALRQASCNGGSDSSERKEITNMCTGCGVCAIACCKECISIEKNEKGFYQAYINSRECIDCNLCREICGQNVKRFEITQIKNQELFAGYRNNSKKLMEATSGGFCTYLAEKALDKGVPVLGVYYNYELNRAEHIVIEERENLKELTGSKYLQSYSVDAFKTIKDLNEGVIIGTPCQIASISRYLEKNKKRNQFVLIDIICHGVPSYLLWDKYINAIDGLSNLKFRDKSFGWHGKTISYCRNGKQIHIAEKKDKFYHFFNEGNVFNASCYECSYRDQSAADIRVGDYWGPLYEKNEDGRNMLIPISEWGYQIVKSIKNDEFIIEKGCIEDYLRYQQTENFRIPLQYEDILEELKSTKSLEKVDKKYNSISRMENRVRRIISKMRR